MITSRPYAGTQDLPAMKRLLSAGQAALPHGYSHIGELDWWVFYNPSGEPQSERFRLWENEVGELVAWSFSSQKRSDFDLFVHPAWRIQHEETIFNEIEGRAIAIAQRQPAREDGKRVMATFASTADTIRPAMLAARGYTESPFLLFFEQPLNKPIPEPRLPEGFRFLDRMHLDYADPRADVHFNSFNPSRMTPDYYRGFMQAPLYDPELDVVVVAPDGRFASFAMGWIDAAISTGIFEPVGTRNEFQRLGLGRATLYEGMRRWQARGVAKATVGCNADKPGNIAFYESAGFQKAYWIPRYEKTI